MKWIITFEESYKEGILSSNYTANTKKDARDKFERTFTFPNFVIISIKENLTVEDYDLFEGNSWMF